MAVFETILDEIGGMGRFQVILNVILFFCQITLGWSMLQMALAKVVPEYHCIILDDNSTNSTLSASSYRNEENSNVCSLNGTECSSFEFSHYPRTAASEWSLLCDRSWVLSTIISFQMAGVLIGALVSGQMSDSLGRKKTLYFFVVFHIVNNFVAAASSSWIMFCALRFFIGISIGAIVVVAFTYPMEFMPIKWRPLLPILPIWSVGVALLAIVGYVIHDWVYLHIACAIASMPCLLGIFIVPESMRWLTLHGKEDEAEKVLAQIARWNRKPLPAYTRQALKSVRDKEKEQSGVAGGKSYSFIDIFRGWKQAVTSIILCYFWFVLSVSYYGISFGVGSLHGNIYLNIFLLGVVDIPFNTLTFYTNNAVGRKISTFAFFLLSALACLGCLLSANLVSGEKQGVIISVLCISSKMFGNAAWACVLLWGSELYPTVTRNIGTGFATCGARIGGILAPFVIDFEARMSLSYGILLILLTSAMLLCLVLPETKGISLKDSPDSPDEADIDFTFDPNEGEFEKDDDIVMKNKDGMSPNGDTIKV